MRWRRGGRSRNLEDRRRSRGRFGGGGLPVGRGGIGLSFGGLLFVLLLSVIFQQDFLGLLFSSGGAALPGPGGSSPGRSDAGEEELVEFVSFVLDDNQELWARLLPGQGASYRDATLVLFRDVVRSACGVAESTGGPFYCPGDRKVYIDLGFYEALRRRFGAPGDFAQAYVIAHEIGHHVQNLLRIEPEVRRLQRERPDRANDLSVRMELQADCLAGIWGNSAAAAGILEPGDLEEGLNAAAAIGDDRIQQMSGRSVNPEAFTHGSSQQRVDWFQRGYRSGDPDVCDTFAGLG